MSMEPSKWAGCHRVLLIITPEIVNHLLTAECTFHISGVAARAWLFAQTQEVYIAIKVTIDLGLLLSFVTNTIKTY